MEKAAMLHQRKWSRREQDFPQILLLRAIPKFGGRNGPPLLKVLHHRRELGAEISAALREIIGERGGAFAGGIDDKIAGDRPFDELKISLDRLRREGEGKGLVI